MQNVAGLLDSGDIVLGDLALDEDITVINESGQRLEAALDVFGQLGAVLLQIHGQGINLGQNIAAQLSDPGRGLAGHFLDILLELLGVDAKSFEKSSQTNVERLDRLLGANHNCVALGSAAQVLGRLGDGADTDAHAARDATRDGAAEVDDAGGLVGFASGGLLRLRVRGLGKVVVDNGLEAIHQGDSAGVDLRSDGRGGRGGSQSQVVGS